MQFLRGADSVALRRNKELGQVCQHTADGEVNHIIPRLTPSLLDITREQAMDVA